MHQYKFKNNDRINTLERFRSYIKYLWLSLALYRTKEHSLKKEIQKAFARFKGLDLADKSNPDESLFEFDEFFDERFVVFDTGVCHVYISKQFHLLKEQKYPAILIPGALNGALDMYDLGKLLAENNIPIIMIDAPGFGESFNFDGDYNLDNVAETIKNLLEKLNIEKCNLVGHSWGGAFAVRTGDKFPHLVEEIISLDGSHLDVPEHLVWRYGVSIPVVRDMYTGILSKFSTSTGDVGQYAAIQYASRTKEFESLEYDVRVDAAITYSFVLGNDQTLGPIKEAKTRLINSFPNISGIETVPTGHSEIHKQKPGGLEIVFSTVMRMYDNES